GVVIRVAERGSTVGSHLGAALVSFSFWAPELRGIRRSWALREGRAASPGRAFRRHAAEGRGHRNVTAGCLTVPWCGVAGTRAPRLPSMHQGWTSMRSAIPPTRPTRNRLPCCEPQSGRCALTAKLRQRYQSRVQRKMGRPADERWRGPQTGWLYHATRSLLDECDRGVRQRREEQNPRGRRRLQHADVSTEEIVGSGCRCGS